MGDLMYILLSDESADNPSVIISTFQNFHFSQLKNIPGILNQSLVCICIMDIRSYTNLTQLVFMKIITGSSAKCSYDWISF